jgi:hypothetical protein
MRQVTSYRQASYIECELCSMIAASIWVQPRNHDASAIDFKLHLPILNQNFAKLLGEFPSLQFKTCQSGTSSESSFSAINALTDKDAADVIQETSDLTLC